MPLPGGLLLILNWFIPGLGFWICRRRARGAMQFLLVLITFGLGIALKGGVDWPSWSVSEQNFNLINNFTFIIQLGAGLPALISLLAHQLPDWMHLGFLNGVPTDPYYDLGGFYIIVAGAMNYFATCNLHDRLLRPNPRFEEQERGEDAEARPVDDSRKETTSPS